MTPQFTNWESEEQTKGHAQRESWVRAGSRGAGYVRTSLAQS